MTDMIEEKGSISKVQKSTGIYRFQVEGYSGLSTRVGDSIESPEFTLCGYTWQLRIFPGGSLDNHKGYLSYYLASKSNKVARASYKLSVINQVMGGEDECFCSSGARIFEAKGVQVSHAQFDVPYLNLCLRGMMWQLG
ncbi:MATH domain-containing protein [archaeon]|nr:MAG: MATH domain-containing protein [archaeon]